MGNASTLCGSQISRACIRWIAAFFVNSRACGGILPAESLPPPSDLIRQDENVTDRGPRRLCRAAFVSGHRVRQIDHTVDVAADGDMGELSVGF